MKTKIEKLVLKNQKMLKKLNKLTYNPISDLYCNANMVEAYRNCKSLISDLEFVLKLLA